MPSNLVDTPKEEKMWKKAKQKVKKQKDKNYGDFSDQDWGLVNHIFQNMKKSHSSCSNPDCNCDPCLCADHVPGEWLGYLSDLSEKGMVKTIKDVDRDDQGHYVLVFDGNDEFWFVDEGVPVWRSEDFHVKETVEEWNKKMPEDSITVEFLEEKTNEIEQLPKYQVAESAVNIPEDEVLEAISQVDQFDDVLKNVISVGAKYFSNQEECANWATEWCIENDEIITEKTEGRKQREDEEYNPLEPLVNDENFDQVRDFLCSLDYLSVDEVELVLNNEKSPELALLPKDAEKLRVIDRTESHYSDPFIWQHDLPFVLMGELNKDLKSKGLKLKIKSHKPSD